MGRLTDFVAFVCIASVFISKSNAQVQSVTARNDDDVPEFLKNANSNPTTTTTEEPPTPTTPKLTRAQIDEQRFREVKGTEPSEFWMNVGQDLLKKRLETKPIEKVAKNIIYFIGDGMSVPTVTGARILKGQLSNMKFGEEAQLHMEKFPYLGASKTFCSDAQVADSACSATALFCGSKTNYKTIGVTPKVLSGNCVEQMKPENQLSSILEWAQKAGKSTGIVTTTRITHATPAGTYAHIAHRDWENDGEVTKAGFNADECDDIAEQLILKEPGMNINVILGGGRKHLLPSSVVDEENGEKGTRNDTKNLIEKWRAHKKGMQGKKGVYVTTVEDLLDVNTKDVDYLLGLFAMDHIEYADNITMNHDPTLLNMTNVAIKILSKNPNGYFLMVEGGRIDHALHDAFGQRALLEAIEFDKAIQLADDRTNDDETLIVVTSDHSHVMSVAGYPVRGNDILGIAENSDVDELPYTTISFANGPGFRNHTNGFRPNITEDPLRKVDYKIYGGIPTKYETHGGDDVFIFAKGPYAHLLTGVNLQNYIPHMMGYAACIAPEGQQKSPLCAEDEARATGAAGQLTSSNFSLSTVLVLLAILTANLFVGSSL